jgi:hypothetical protein
MPVPMLVDMHSRNSIKRKHMNLRKEKVPDIKGYVIIEQLQY